MQSKFHSYSGQWAGCALLMYVGFAVVRLSKKHPLDLKGLSIVKTCLMFLLLF